MQKLIFSGLLIISTLLNTFKCQASDNTLPHTLKRTAHMAELDTKLPQAKKQRVDNNSAILRAIANNDWTTVTLAIKSGAYKNDLPFLIEKQENREHLLRIAAFEGKTDLVKNLLETKVNVNAKTKLGYAILDTTLCGFEKHGNNSDAIKLLIQAGAQVTNPINYSQGKILVSILKSMFDEEKYTSLASFLSKIDDEDDRIIKGYHILIEEALKRNYHQFIPYLIALCDLDITTPCFITYYRNSLHNANLHTPTKNYGEIVQQLNDCPALFSSHEDHMITDYTTKLSKIDDTTDIQTSKKIGTIKIPGIQQPFDLHFSLEHVETINMKYEVKIDDNPKPIAFIKCNYFLRGLFIDELFVEKDFSKKGIGSLLVTKTIELAKALGCIHINLHANPTDYHKNRNIEELALWYRKFGFIGDQQEEENSLIFIPMLLTLINLELPEYAYSKIYPGEHVQALALRLRTSSPIT